MKILAVDASGQVASVAVATENGILAEYSVDYLKTHSQTLLPMIDEILKMTDTDKNALDAIAVSEGPGSFTGLRIGSATAKGLGLAMGAPVYVCSKDMEANTVTVGPEENLFSTTLIAKDCNWFPFEALTKPITVTAKARSRHKEQPATVTPLPDGSVQVVFDTPQRALTTGQAVVFYDEETVIGRDWEAPSITSSSFWS